MYDKLIVALTLLCVDADPGEAAVYAAPQLAQALPRGGL
jgi:hypothetical protein